MRLLLRLLDYGEADGLRIRREGAATSASDTGRDLLVRGTGAAVKAAAT
ncbi:hypothetical protein [Dictyobacter vulcani]|nr:hypothetical protein [Dictyobacter vulcani]